ncbi:hypothetical protein HDU98_001761 [Podochytrium sp. JEL0797]|nr:hypothetical protein HDU98_001761 [Podochytrium sp. JEL0797]
MAKKTLTIEGLPTTADCAGMQLEAVKDLPTTLRRLDISDNALTSGNLNFSTATSLTWLDLKSNSLTTLSGLETLKAIQILNLGANKLSSIASLPHFGMHLKALILNNNFLTTLPDLSPLTNLNTLVLSHNNLTSLPKPFPRLPQLKKLSLSNNQLVEYPCFTAPPPPIQELRMAHNNVKLLPVKNPKAGAGTYTIPTLRTLDLGSNALEDLKNLVAALGGVLAPVDALTNLNLKGNPVAMEEEEEEAGKGKADGYKHAVIKVAGSSLKVLDGVRFDVKFLERKVKRKESGWLARQQQEQQGEKGVEEGDDAPAVAVKPKQAAVKKGVPIGGKPVAKAALASKKPSSAGAVAPAAKKSAGPSTANPLKRKSEHTTQESPAPKKSAKSDSVKETPAAKKSVKSDAAPKESPAPKKSAKPEADTFFKESFKPSAAVTKAAAAAHAAKPVETKAETVAVKKQEKQLDKHEERLRSGVVGVVEVKPVHKKTVKGAKVVVKSAKVEDLEKAASASAFGTGLAPAWD